jgi:Zn-dependent peptidase ImmA (M78 family)/DNA-binding XRE family transcriptional regulator
MPVYLGNERRTEMQALIGKRIKAARQRAGLTQHQLSNGLGFKDRQTLSAIESGLRKVSAEELLRAMQVLGCALEYFTDPFRLDGEGSFSWRTSTKNAELIDEFESWAGRCLALYRELADYKDVLTAPLRLGLTTRSSYEDAHGAAEWLAREWELGNLPAAGLEEAIRERLRAQVLYVDAPDGISGAGVRLSELSAILINRNEPTGRRHFDLAHELFHVLTWDTIKPDHSEDAAQMKPKKRSEQLANCFASALLMPEGALRAWWEEKPHDGESQLRSWMGESALELQVTVPALLWRLVQLGMLDKDAVGAYEHGPLTVDDAEAKPRIFSLDFVKVVKRGIEEGRISIRRAAAVLDMSIDELANLFREHSMEVPFDL